MTEATILRFRCRKVLGKEKDFVTEIAHYDDLGVEAAEQLRRVFATGTQIFRGLTRGQIGLMRILAARRGIEIPF